MGSFDYQACLLGIKQTDPDPSAAMPLWLSRGRFHFWHPSQPTPAREWEARIDERMEQQMTATDSGDRKKLYDEVQAIVAEQAPMLDLVVPHVLIAAHRSVLELDPTPFGHVLWNSDEIAIGAVGEKHTMRMPRDLRH